MQGGLAKLSADGIHAQAVLARVADKGLRIDRAGKMHMQIGALGKLIQKGVQGQRAAFHGGFVGARGADFGAIWTTQASDALSRPMEQQRQGKARQATQAVGRMIAFQCSAEASAGQ